MKQEVVCSECTKKKLQFIDLRDITSARWRILGMSLNTGLPIVICNSCEWSPPGGTQQRQRPRQLKQLSLDPELQSRLETLSE